MAVAMGFHADPDGTKYQWYAKGNYRSGLKPVWGVLFSQRDGHRLVIARVLGSLV